MSLLYLDAGDAVADDANTGTSAEGTPTIDLHLGEEVRYVDPSVLQNLAEQLRSREVAARFALDYARLWARRQRSVEAALESQDRKAALDAVLSLKVSSAMVGAVRLARLAEKLELLIRGKGDLQGAQAFLVQMAEHGKATVKELQGTYLKAGA